MTAALDTVGSRIRQGQILVVDDDPAVQAALAERLASAHYDVVRADSLADAATAVSGDGFDVILLDSDLPDASGTDALRRIKAEAISAGVVMMATAGTTESVVEAIRLGALDYLTKPLDADKVIATVALAARAGRLERENRRLTRRLHELESDRQLIGHSPVSRRLSGVVRRVADSDATVLIEGKAGTGKSWIAEVIHQGGRRASESFVVRAGDGLDSDGLVAALDMAQRGSLLIEGVDELPGNTQSRLVRVLKERSGDDSTEVRILASTSARLPELVAKGKFREDLYYRLNVFPIQVPALHERRDDIPLFAAQFLKEAAQGQPTAGFTAAAMILLETHPWPGNLTQLRNAITRAWALAQGEAIDREHLLGPSTGLEDPDPQAAQPELHSARDDDGDRPIREEEVIPFEAEEKRILARALRATQGNVRRAAQLLRIGRATLYRKIQIYQLRLH